MGEKIYEEFILRDGEIAFIENGQTRMIMNVNTAIDLLTKLGKLKTPATPAPAVTVKVEAPAAPAAKPAIPKVPDLVYTVPTSVYNNPKTGNFYVSSDGRIFGRQSDAEKYYGLGPGTVSRCIIGFSSAESKKLHKYVSFSTISAAAYRKIKNGGFLPEFAWKLYADTVERAKLNVRDTRKNLNNSRIPASYWVDTSVAIELFK